MFFTGPYLSAVFTILAFLSLSLLIYSTVYSKHCASWWVIPVGAALCVLPFASVGSYFIMHFSALSTNKKCTDIEREVIKLFRYGIKV